MVAKNDKNKLPPAASRVQHLNIAQVEQVTRISRRTIYRKIAVGEFPAPIKEGKEHTWPVSWIERWQDAQWDKAAAEMERLREATA